MKLGDVNRFLSKIEFTETCWNWNGTIEKNGYGRFWYNKKNIGAHQFSYMIFHNFRSTRDKPIDHLCRNTICVNPNHLELVTPLINTQRGFGNRNKEKIHCPKGHLYDEKNTRIKNGSRNCKMCDYLRNKKKRLDDPEKWNEYCRNNRQKSKIPKF